MKMMNDVLMPEQSGCLRTRHRFLVINAPPTCQGILKSPRISTVCFFLPLSFIAILVYRVTRVSRILTKVQENEQLNRRLATYEFRCKVVAFSFVNVVRSVLTDKGKIYVGCVSRIRNNATFGGHGSERIGSLLWQLR